MNELHPFSKPYIFDTNTGKEACLHSFCGDGNREIAKRFINKYLSTGLCEMETYKGGKEVSDVLKKFGQRGLADDVRRVKNIRLYLLESLYGVNCALVYGKEELKVGDTKVDSSSEKDLESEILGTDIEDVSKKESSKPHYKVLDKVLGSDKNPAELFSSYRKKGENYITADECMELMSRKIFQDDKPSKANIKGLVIITSYKDNKRDRSGFSYELYNFKNKGAQVFYPKEGFFYLEEPPKELTSKGTYITVAPDVYGGLIEVYLHSRGKISSMSLGEPKKSRKQRKKRKKENG